VGAPTWRALADDAVAEGIDATEVRWLVEEASGTTGVTDDECSALTHHRFRSMVERRLGGEPLQYVLGHWAFRRLDLLVDRRVLIPRPDTEPLVEWALEWVRQRLSATVGDIGTGSGAIAVSLAAHAPEGFSGRIIAVDLSPDALAIAGANADALLPPERRSRLTFRQGSLTEPLHEPVDLLLANLPYLTPRQIAQNPDLDAEPRLALDGGTDGLDLVREAIADLPRILAPVGAAGFEIDPSQAEVVRGLLEATFPGAETTIIHDLAQESRHVLLIRRDPLDNAAGSR